MEERGIGGENGMAATPMDAAQEIGRIIAQNKGIMWIKAYIVERWHIYFESNVQLEKRIQEEIEQIESY